MNIHEVIKLLKQEIKKYKEPIVGKVARKYKRAPFRILLSTMLSLRTKDGVTSYATQRLFKLGSKPEDFLKIPDRVIEKAIYPTGFYRVKTKNIKKTCKLLVERYNSSVPDNIDELLKLSGVGRKTANLVLTLGFNKYSICVDTHVHRITNRLGYVKTKTTAETEFALRKKLPKRYWKIINDLLVTFGQNVCVPVSPFCSKCRIVKFCKRIGVVKSR